jgi:hypothetical protein
MTDPNDIADRLRCSGIGNVPAADLATLRAHAETLTPRERVRLRFPWGDSIIEGPVDDLWETLGREPTAEEYDALAEVAREAVAYCERAARERATRAPERP